MRKLSFKQIKIPVHRYTNSKMNEQAYLKQALNFKIKSQFYTAILTYSSRRGKLANFHVTNLFAEKLSC